MKKLTTGHDSTLESYHMLASLVFGKKSKAVKFLDEKIKASPNGAKEEVLADEQQMILLLASL